MARRQRTARSRQARPRRLGGRRRSAACRRPGPTGSRRRKVQRCAPSPSRAGRIAVHAQPAVRCADQHHFLRRADGLANVGDEHEAARPDRERAGSRYPGLMRRELSTRCGPSTRSRECQLCSGCRHGPPAGRFTLTGAKQSLEHGGPRRHGRRPWAGGGGGARYVRQAAGLSQTLMPRQGVDTAASESAELPAGRLTRSGPQDLDLDLLS